MGSKLVTALAVLGGIGLAVLGIMDLPPVSWINDLQARWFGGYSEKLTFFLCVLIVVVPFGILSSVLKGAEDASNAEQKQAVARRLEQRPFQGRD